jgi:hypothetical protein
MRPVLAGSGVLGATLNLGRVVGPTGPVTGRSGNYLFISDTEGTSGNTGLHFDFDGRNNIGLPKLELYREKIHDIGTETGTEITVDAKNGPIQRVNLTNLNTAGSSIVDLVLTKTSWNSGQGVTVIIEHNVTDGDLSSAATWRDTDSTHVYNARPQLLPNRKTMVYVVAYNGNDSGAPTDYYITSQTFGLLS